MILSFLDRRRSLRILTDSPSVVAVVGVVSNPVKLGKTM